MGRVALGISISSLLLPVAGALLLSASQSAAAPDSPLNASAWVLGAMFGLVPGAFLGIIGASLGVVTMASHGWRGNVGGAAVLVGVPVMLLSAAIILPLSFVW